VRNFGTRLNVDVVLFMLYFISKFWVVFKGILRGFFSKSEYYIKKGYLHRKEYVFYDTRGEKGEVYQKEVYQFVQRLVEKKQLQKIVDIGCGSADKLIQYLSNYETIGIEVSPTFEYLLEKYPKKKWIKAKEKGIYEVEADLIICADVIEHLIKPEYLIEQILSIQNWQYLVISTPERNIIRGCNDWGPPKNIHHIREWDGREFRAFMQEYFHIETHQISNFQQGTQLLLCTPKK